MATNYELMLTRLKIVGDAKHWGRPVRLTQVSITDDQVFVEITDVNEDVPVFLSTGSIQCPSKDGGVVVNKLSAPGGEVTTQEDLINHLRMGYALTYVLQWDKCSRGDTTANKWWSGRICELWRRLRAN